MSSAGIDILIPWQPAAAVIVALLLAIAAPAAAADPYAAARLEMVRTFEVIASEAGGGATPTLSASVLEAMRALRAMPLFRRPARQR
jgi:hypothetical protein